jgi:hypothetical protein
LVNTRVFSISYTASTWVPLIDARIIMGSEVDG